jgi:hypothetical protein
MRRKPPPEEEIQYLIADTIRGYRRAAKYRAGLLDEAELTPMSEKSQRTVKIVATLARICNAMSQELLNLYALEERLRQASGKDLRIVIEQVDSPWNKADNGKEA